MPTVKSGESEKNYIARCIPYVMDNEGLDQKQAAGKCYGMFRNARKSQYIQKAIDIVKKVIVDHRKMAMIAHYENEINKWLEDHADVRLTKSGERMFSETYSVCRKSGVDETGAATIAQRIVMKRGLNDNSHSVMKEIAEKVQALTKIISVKKEKHGRLEEKDLSIGEKVISTGGRYKGTVERVFDGKCKIKLDDESKKKEGKEFATIACWETKKQ